MSTTLAAAAAGRSAFLRRTAAARAVPSTAAIAVAAARTRRSFWGGGKNEPAPGGDPNERVNINEAEALLMSGIKSIGYSEGDATIMKDAMMWAQLRDNNQGIIKLTSGGLAKSGDGQPSIELESPTGARVNGNQAMSMVVLQSAVQLAIEKAKTANVALVGTYNTSQSCGALGFTRSRSWQGLIGLVFATSPEFVAPFGAKQPILGTNPIACGVPTDSGLLLIDQATAAFPWFGLLEHKTAGTEIPEGVAYDADGHPTRDPNKALKGALRTFDRGYKSSNLALMVELLAGPLVGAAHVNKLSAKNWGNLVVAIHPSLLGDAGLFYKSAGEVLDRVRNADKLPGVNEIVIAGQREAAMAQARISEGTLPIERNMLQELRAMAAKYDQGAGATGQQQQQAQAQAQAGGAGGVGERQVQLLEQLVHRLDKLEAQVVATAQQQTQLGKQQSRLEAVTVEKFKGMNGAAR